MPHLTDPRFPNSHQWGHTGPEGGLSDIPPVPTGTGQRFADDDALARVIARPGGAAATLLRRTLECFAERRLRTYRHLEAAVAASRTGESPT